MEEMFCSLDVSLYWNNLDTKALLRVRLSSHFEEPRKVPNVQFSILKEDFEAFIFLGGFLLHGVIGSF